MSKNNADKDEQKEGRAELPQAEPGEDSARAEDAVDEAAARESEMEKLRHEFLLQRADFENTRKRLEREKADYARYASLPLLRDLVDALDNFELALSHAPKDDPMRKGVAMALDGMMKTLGKYNVKKTGAKGERFDPSLHEAVSMTSDPSLPDGAITEVARPGYILHDRLVRPASVMVNRRTAGDEQAEK